MHKITNLQDSTTQNPLSNTGDDSLLTQKQVSKILGVQTRTLESWRIRGGGPKFVRISARCIRYKIAEIREWIDKRTKSSTSEA